MLRKSSGRKTKILPTNMNSTAEYSEVNVRAVKLPGASAVRSVKVGDTNASQQSAVTWTLSAAYLAIVETITTVMDTTYSMFLPKGYPESVSPDYLMFQAMDSLQARA